MAEVADVSTLFGVIAFGFAVALGTELVQYFLLYRTSSFRALKANFEKHAAKVDEARDASTSKAVKKREARLQGWEEEAGKQLAAVNMKAGVIVMISVLASWRFIPRIFGNVAVVRLPFEPPSFMLKATQRGIQGIDDPRAGSALFIFMLCQACFRTILGKVLQWGPSRRMSEIKPTIPKAFKQN